MSVQQPAQLRQQANTVYVAAPKAGDTVTVRVTSGTVQVRDTLHAVVRQTGGEGYVFASLFLTFVLVGVTIWAQLRINRLQTTNNDLQAEHAKLQREFNQMEAQHEAERRAAERQRQQDHQRATDTRISGIAYALRRQLRSWLDEAPTELTGLVSMADAWWDAERKAGTYTEGSDVPGVTEGMMRVSAKWAQRYSGEHFDRAEARVLQLLAAIPDASPEVTDSIRRAFVLFYEATLRLNQQMRTFDDIGEVEPQGLAAAYHELEDCIKALSVAVDEELQKLEGERLRRL